ncbi:hypothetical protein GCM10010123_37020 [Pilimelia anulata]|uniref:Probable inorganic carbon transporter subunit DabA n=1 Tax=Pilimelia anulata TaxID=53371 RepID=A0A8J3B9D2_9ACTN|nr:putative inorganic carbon transporter subunit DabA [Pilimelia anulata]GGK03657.1 hypothetical protein GCM10010123_37020 [Pilimelia anulata]
MTATVGRAGPAADVAALVAHAARLLPSQAPLSAFVHHNTLHAYEHLPFDAAVRAGAARYGTEPYPAEAALTALLADGRITPADLAAVAADVAGDEPVLPGGPTHREFVAGRLALAVELPRGAALTWLLTETDALARYAGGLAPDRHADLAAAGPAPAVLGRLWQRLAAATPPAAAAPADGVRCRDRILARTGADTDAVVHPLLIRVCAAFLDQGVAYWPMPGRARGLLAAFRDLYGAGGAPPDRALRGLPALLAAQRGWPAERTVDWALGELAVAPADRAEAVAATLLSLRGWAGMVRQFEEAPDRAPVHAPPARLVDHLAVQLTLDVVAARAAIADHLGPHATPADLDLLRPPPAAPGPDRALAYEGFVVAQHLPVPLDAFADPAAVRAWLAAVRALDPVTRRGLLHRAYERRHAADVLGGLRAHARYAAPAAAAPLFQAVFCIDEREESLRRHLEEVCPGAETLGYAGFFGVAMAYRGVRDVRPRPLCPVVVTPRHLVTEEPVSPAPPRGRRRAALRRAYDIGSRTLARGALIGVGTGLAHLAPLVGRSLLPRRFHRWAAAAGRLPDPGPTRLALHRTAAGPDAAGRQPGFTVAEMADVVAAALRTTGLAGRLAPLVLLVGHGSASLNNPHEAAHDCGATGGGRGGPNARALAAMANDPAVRGALAARGLPIPAGTRFVGAYHNTCDDSITYYDATGVPPAAATALDRARRALDRARALAAHERCRRFATAAPDLPPERALAHVETHTVDLGQPRPEYGHATNAVCVVGRRWRTRGLFLDRRAFLVSYDPAADDDAAILTGLLLAVGPVCAGINLEYYFSHVDPAGYGCGTKLPHNVTGLLGVMDGAASDLRTGLPWQMVEIHEPVRLLLVVEAAPARLLALLAAQPGLDRLVRNGWLRLAAWDGPDLYRYADGRFVPDDTPPPTLPVLDGSAAAYRGRRGPVGCAHIRPAADTAPVAGPGSRAGACGGPSTAGAGGPASGPGRAR